MNKQRERLIKMLDAYYYEKGRYTEWFTEEYKQRLTDYLLDNGVIIPPCKVGDVVYKIIRNNEPLGIAEYIVKGFHFGNFPDNLGHKRKNYLIVKHRTSCLLHHIPFDEIGKTVFFNKEAAAKLAENANVSSYI